MELKLSKNQHTDIISKLFHARTQIHIYHFQTSSYAQHKALDEFYTDIVDKIDEFVEVIQGKLGKKLTGYKSFPYLEDNGPIGFLTTLKNDVEQYRLTVLNKKEFNNLDNQMQVIVDLIEQTLYKLTFLS